MVKCLQSDTRAALAEAEDWLSKEMKGDTCYTLKKI